MKKRLNILIPVISTISISCAIYFIVIFCKYLNKIGRITISNSKTYTVYYWADSLTPITIFSAVFAIIFLLITIASIIMLVIINHTELLAAKESISDYRKRKAEEREQRKQLKTAKRKAKLLAELDEINRKDKV